MSFAASVYSGSRREMRCRSVVRISLRGIDNKGMLNKISQYISFTMGVNMREIHLGGKDGVMEGYIELLVQDRSKLAAMIKGLSKIEGIQDVVRTDI